MEIIINAGDARDFISKALDKVAESDYSAAKELMEKANQKLVAAHRIQTKKLQKEAEGDAVEYSVLFTHAQDTVMTMSEYNLSKKLIDIFERKEGKR
ncbi:PTS lactose/cellobiose transporter subunit IIA [Pediococcus acidilactici]|nr:PTS lactose/cellobiose transporter subunit IIA [Pediococcus acidilactici]